MSYSSVSFPFANELCCPLLENTVTVLYWSGFVLSQVLRFAYVRLV